MLFELEIVKLNITVILEKISSIDSNQNTVDDIIAIINSNYSSFDRDTLLSVTFDELSKIDYTLRTKIESILDFDSQNNDADINKILSLIGYDKYLKLNAMKFLEDSSTDVLEQINLIPDFSSIKGEVEIDDSCKDEAKEIDVSLYLTMEYGVDQSQIMEISSLSEYVDFVKSLSGQIVSRGHSNYKYHFLPTAHRSVEGVYMSNLEIRKLLSEFKRKVVHYHPEFKTKTSWELTAFAQHYGLPTYMLDFTESHLVSLLFALENLDTTENGLIIFLNFQSYNSKFHDVDYIVDCSDSTNRHSNNKTTSEMLQQIRLPILIKSDSLNDRIHFQKGVFLLFPENVNLKENGNYEDVNVISDCINLVVIPKSIKADLIEELFNIGMTFESIYPDLDNAVRSIKFKSILDGRYN